VIFVRGGFPERGPVCVADATGREPMGLTMKEKQAVTRQMALEYKRATKAQKGDILDTLIQLTGYNRFLRRPCPQGQSTNCDASTPR